MHQPAMDPQVPAPLPEEATRKSSSVSEDGPAPGGLQRELEARLARATPGDTVLGFFFNAVLKAVRAQQDEAMLRRCQEAVANERFLSFFSYPVPSFLRLLYAAAGELSAQHGGFEGALLFLGHRMSPDFLDSSAGRALLMLSGKNPRLLLNSVPMAYRLVCRHGDCQVEWTGPRLGLVVIKGTCIPYPYYEGSLQETLDQARMPGAKVKGRQVGLDCCELEVSWR